MFKLISTTGAIHIDGLEIATIPAADSLNYSLSPCGGLTKIRFFNSKRATAADLDELANTIETMGKIGHRMCKTCKKNAQRAIDAEKSEPVETFEIVYESMNSKGETSRRRVTGPAAKRDAVTAELLADPKFIAFVN